MFSVRSETDLGVGEFLDLKLLVDWAVAAGFHLVQLLPINDTSVHQMWWDSYPYRYGNSFGNGQLLTMIFVCLFHVFSLSQEGLYILFGHCLLAHNLGILQLMTTQFCFTFYFMPSDWAWDLVLFCNIFFF